MAWMATRGARTMRGIDAAHSRPLTALLLLLLLHTTSAQIDYKDALMKSILFYEGQRSGPLDLTSLRNTWRNSSGLEDGFAQGVDLTGGYYDAGDNIKFHFPLAFSMTMLSWSILEYQSQLSGAGQLDYARDALRWGTDYLLKCHTAPNVFWGQVGIGGDDHSCWQRPEDMDTLRTAFKIDAANPGSDLAAEAAAAMAAASIVFNSTNPSYSSSLIAHSKQLFTFAITYKRAYSQSISDAAGFYNSWSGYNDELAWAAAWLYQATGDSWYITYLVDKDGSLGTSGTSLNEFSWDNKYAGAQILLSGTLLFNSNGFAAGTMSYLNRVKQRADSYACNNLPKTKSVKYTPQGLVYIRGVNLQYVTNAAFLVAVYSDYLHASGNKLVCGSVTYSPSDMLAFSKHQVDYILGTNNAQMSYMVGFGSKYPLKPHHRGASIISIRQNPTKVACKGGFTWLNSPNANPNVHIGAIVGGPDANDNYKDDRSQYNYGEPTTYTNAGAVGVIARMLGPGTPQPISNPPPSTTKSPLPSTTSQPPPSTTTPQPPPPSTSTKRPPPPSTSAKRPPPPSTSTKRPPPPSTSTKRPPPPSTSTKRPPPPSTTVSPPISSPDGITIYQSAEKNWTDNVGTVTQFNVVIGYTGSGSIKNLKLALPNFQPYGFWNILPTSDPNVYDTPSWAVLSTTQTFSFGYQQYGDRAAISVHSYTKV